MSIDAAAASPAVARSQGRLFHTGMAVALLLTAVIGFGPTYFFKPVHPSPPLSPLLHAHGMVFTAWLILLIVQSGLVRAERTDVHKRLGMVGALLAALVVVLGFSVAIYAARRGTAADGMTPLGFMIFPFGQILLFGGFVGAGLWNRRKPELHRRLILVGTICMMTPAISRMVDKRSVLAMFLTVGFVVVAMIHDWLSRRRVHPVFIVGGLLLLVSGPLRAVIGKSAAWESFARMLVG
jgi:EamA domain-containing membrane protein RarD